MKCILCSAEIKDDPLFSVVDYLSKDARTFKVNGCASCGTIMVNPAPTEDELAGLYPTDYNFKVVQDGKGFRDIVKRLEWNLFYRRIYERDFRLIRRAVGKDKFRLLDVGCGSGLRLKVFKEHGCDVEGNEISESCVNYISSSFKITVHKGKLEDIKLSGQGFDAISMFALFEHLISPIKVIDAARRLLNPGGLLIVQVPVTDSIQYGLLGKRSGMVHDMPRHVFIPSVRSFVQFMDRNGFTLVSVRPVSIFESAALFALGIFPKASTPDAYAQKPVSAILSRIAGWILTLFPGVLIGLVEKIRGIAAENIFIFAYQEKK